MQEVKKMDYLVNWRKSLLGHECFLYDIFAYDKIEFSKNDNEKTSAEWEKKQFSFQNLLRLTNEIILTFHENQPNSVYLL